MKESKIEKDLKEVLETFGFSTNSIHGKTSKDNGMPDVIAVTPDCSRIITFEVKKPSNTFRLEQLRFMKRYKYSYQITFKNGKWVVTSYFNGEVETDLKTLLNKILEDSNEK
jgi:Holliday junction resolvase